MARSRSDPFRTPPVSYDYGPVIEAMALCRERVVLLTREYGEQTALRREAEALLVDIDVLAKLLPDDAENRVRPDRRLHSTL